QGAGGGDQVGAAVAVEVHGAEVRVGAGHLGPEPRQPRLAAGLLQGEEAAEPAGEQRLPPAALLEHAQAVAVGKVEVQDPVTWEISVGHQQGGPLAGDEQVGPGPLAPGVHAAPAGRGRPGEGDLVVRLVAEATALVEVDADAGAVAVPRHHGHVGPAVAVEVAEGGRGGADVPGGDDDVL